MSNVLVIGDTHLPFEHKHYLDFCHQTARTYKCNQVVHIGDVVDNHSISYHDHDPDGMSPKDELHEARRRLKKWFKAFPQVLVCKGNHDVLANRKAITHGIPEEHLRKFEDVWEFPSGWRYEWHYVLGSVKYQHGTGYSGKYAHLKVASINRQSTVIGHLHSVAGVDFHANELDIIWGMSTGCGIDRKNYAFWYGKDFKDKPVLSCGVVINNGRLPILVPMKI